MQSGCIILYFHQQYMHILVVPSIFLPMFGVILSLFFFLVILVEMN